MTRALALALALAATPLAPTLAAPTSIELIELPERLTLPMPAGTNKLFAVRIEGKPAAIWMATAADAPDARRLPLQPMGGRYVFNLGDPRVDAVVAGAGQFQIFATFADGRRAESLPVQFVAATPARAQLQLVTRDARALGAGQRWVQPGEIDRLDLTWTGAGPRKPVTLRLGEQTIPIEPGPDGRVERPVDDALRAGWHAAGKLEVVDHASALLATIEAAPDRLATDEPAEFRVTQRRSAEVPGSRGFLRLHLGDISGGKVELSLHTALGETIASTVARERTVVPFTLGARRYTLTLDRLVNVLVGDDHAEFVVQPAPEPAK